MTYHVSKDDVHVLCDNESELRIAIAVLNSPTVASVHIPVVPHIEAAVPDWRVGGPVHPYVPNTQGISADELDSLEDDKPALTLVPPTESDDSVPEVPTVQHIPVRAKLLEVLECIMLFPEGVESRGVCELLGVGDKGVGNRIQRLKQAGLVEQVPHHRRWRATQLARRAKLVKC